MVETKKKSKSSGTLTRCTEASKKQIVALSKRLYKAYPDEHQKLGIRKASSKVAVDALLYWSAMAGELNGTKITDKNNIFCAIRTLSEEI